MKNLTLAGAATVMAMALSSVAGAQTWETDNGTYTLRGCYAANGAVRCDFNFNLTVTDKTQLQVYPGLYKAVAGDGKSYDATQSSAGGSQLTGNTTYLTFYKGVAVPISVLFPAPPSTTTLQIVDLQGVVMRNIPVRNAVATAPVAPRPVAVPIPVTATGAVNVTMTGCTIANGTITCTKAVIAPPR